MLRLDVISFIDILLTLSRHLKRHFSNHRDKIYIYIKFLNRFKFDCTTIILPYLLLREMWFESNQPRKYRKRLAQYRENKGMSIPRTTSAPPFGVNNWPAMRDGISSTGFLPIADRLVELRMQPWVNLTRWQKILSHNCACRPSDGIDRATRVNDPPSTRRRRSIHLRAIILPPPRFLRNKFPFQSSFLFYIIHYRLSSNVVAQLDA